MESCREAGRARSVRRGPAASQAVGLCPGRVRRAGELHARRRDPHAGGAGRHRGRGVRARPLLRSRRAGTVHHAGAGLRLPGSRLQRERRSTSHARARDGLPCRFEVARVPPLPRGTFEVVLLLETMLAFPDKRTLLEGDLGSAHGRRAIRVHARGGPAADRPGASTHARRRHGLADPARGDARAAGAGRAGRPLAGGLQPVPPRHGGLADRCVHRRRGGDRRADRPPGAGRPGRRPPAVERVAGDGTRPQVRDRGGEAAGSGPRPARDRVRLRRLTPRGARMSINHLECPNRAA